MDIEARLAMNSSGTKPQEVVAPFSFIFSRVLISELTRKIVTESLQYIKLIVVKC